MTYQLRDYQSRASAAAVNAFKSKTKKNSVLVLPTGAGKSLVIADIASKIESPLIVLQPSGKSTQSSPLNSEQFDPC